MNHLQHVDQMSVVSTLVVGLKNLLLSVWIRLRLTETVQWVMFVHQILNVQAYVVTNQLVLASLTIQTEQLRFFVAKQQVSVACLASFVNLSMLQLVKS